MSNLVYHYCSAHAFESIVRNKSIWLSPLKHSNDLTEGQYAVHRLRELMMRQQKMAKATEKFECFIDLLSNSHECAGLCFSKEPDLLSQWRGYADDGRGFSIGFLKNSLLRLSENSSKYNSHDVMGLKLLDVEYDQNCQDLMLVPIADRLSTSKSQEETINTLRDFLKIVYILKDKSFSEEKELRLVRWMNINDSKLGVKIFTDMQYKVTGGQLTPYIDLPFKKDLRLIDKVIIGPKNTSQIEHIKNFLHMNGQQEVSVEKSEIPYC
ncbi:MAG: hypothetical protein RI902_2067 [Pseudomonadota bacterium]|jgi:hypothetical protein